MSLAETLDQFCYQQGLEKIYWVAYSGGLDSHVLLSLCRSLPIRLRAIHINHGLSPQADAWAAHCERICADFKIELVTRRLNLAAAAGDSLEALAREKRYAIFADCLQPGDILLTAHHQDDQAETVLLQMLRGAGPKGLAAMPAIKRLGQGLHARPLLTVEHSKLQRYAEEKQLQWVEDESNQNLKLTRNFLRHHIMPVLKTRFPSVATTIGRSAAHCAETQLLLDEYAQAMCSGVQTSQENALSVAKLLALTVAQQRMILRCWIQQQGYPLPDAKKIETIRETVLTAGWDRMPCVTWQRVEVRRYRDALYILPCLAPHCSQQVIQWDLADGLPIAGVGVLQATLARGRGLRANIKNLSVRFRQGGETVSVPGRGQLSLKNLFQEWHVLPWKRDRIPLIFCEEKLINVVGYVLDTAYAVESNEEGWDIHLIEE